MKKQILALLGVGTLAYLSAGGLTLETKAALTAPTNWDYKYYNLGNPGPGARWAMTDGTDTALDPAYVRTVDGSYYNYSQTFSHLTSGFQFLPNGMSITMTFNRSNTQWVSTGTGLFYPTNNYIGSDNTVGSVLNKLYIKFNNQTANDFYVSIDISSGGSDTYNFKLNNKGLFTYFSYVYSYNGTLQQLYIPSYSTFEFYTDTTSNQKYFDAWYLQDLGVSDSYTQGQTDGYDDGYQDGIEAQNEQYDDYYDLGFQDGYDDGYLDGQDSAESNVTSRISQLMNSVFGGLTNILDVKVFDDLTIGTVMLFPIAVTIFFFIFKLVRGGR
jgi:hypothetical protein